MTTQSEFPAGLRLRVTDPTHGKFDGAVVSVDEQAGTVRVHYDDERVPDENITLARARKAKAAAQKRTRAMTPAAPSIPTELQMS